MGVNQTVKAARLLGITFLAVTISFFIRWLLNPWLGGSVPFVVFYAAILFSAWYGGWFYGAFATILSVGLSIQFFIEPIHQFHIDQADDFLTTVLHVGVGGLGIFLIEQLQRAQKRARRESQEKEETLVALKKSQSELLEAQQRLRCHAEELEERVQKRTEALTQSLRFMQEFLYSMAHDLRAPVRAVKGFTDALLHDYAMHLDETAQDYGRRIDAACERMDRLILELLDYGRLSHTRLELKPVPLRHLIETVAGELKDEIAEHEARLDIGNTEQTVLGNEVALKQIFRNLISNGIKFGTAERKPEIQIWAERDREDIKVFVQDNGIGIAPQHIEQIFKPFHRLHTPEEFPGVGMGLAIARLSAERMGAKLGVESFPGKGSCFYLDIKRAPAQEHPTFVADLLHA